MRIKYCLVAWLLVLLSGCAHQNPPTSTPIPIPTAAAVSENSAASENLSTQTVAPVGYKKFLGIFTPYRITVQQGNFVSEEMASQLKVGMTREQVRFVLGTALLADMFHADRWDYVFRLLKPSGELLTSRVTVYFDHSLVSKIERGDLPNEQDYLIRITNAAITDRIGHVDGSEKPKPKN